VQASNGERPIVLVQNALRVQATHFKFLTSLFFTNDIGRHAVEN